MSRLALSARLSLIAICLVAVAGMLISALAYRVNDMERSAGPPPPDQVARIVRLFEDVPAKNRPLLEETLETGLIRADLDPAGDLPLSEPGLAPVEPAVSSPYAAALAPRPVVVYGDERNLAWLTKTHPALSPPLVFRVELADGEILTLESKPAALLNRQGLPMGLPAGILGTLIALGALLWLRRDTRPLADLARTLESLDPAKGPVTLPPAKQGRRGREMAALSAAFDRLQGRIATLTAGRLALIGGLQHDMRAFATRLRLRVEAIPDDDDRTAAVRDIQDIISLLDDALLASRSGAGDLALDLELLAPHDLIAAEAGIHPLTASPTARTARVLADRLALRRVVANLVDNARQHGEGRLALDLTLEDTDLVLTVDDDGPGIPEAQRPMLLEPFTRLETSRARHTGGAGLGLAVSRSLARALGGELTIGDAPILGGARLILRLPLYRDLSREGRGT
jgi:signal transduction histidine kinase